MADLVEIGAVKVKGGKITDRWSTLVNPGRPIVGHQMHGITDKDVKKAPDAGRGRRSSSSKFVGDALVVGHNVGFDLGFIEAAARRRLPLRAGPLPRHADARPRGLPGPRELQAGRPARFFGIELDPEPPRPAGRRGDRATCCIRFADDLPGRDRDPARAAIAASVRATADRRRRRRRLLEAARREARVCEEPVQPRPQEDRPRARPRRGHPHGRPRPRRASARSRSRSASCRAPTAPACSPAARPRR